MSKIGISNFHYAKQTAEETALADATYGATTAVPGLVSVEVSNEAQSNTLYADNGPYETASSMGAINVSIDLADLPLSVQGDLLGHSYDTTNKVLVKKANDVAPYVAILFEFAMGNGSTRCVKLYKGKFAEPTDSGQTKGENVEFQTSQITAQFVTLKGKDGNTGKWEYVQDFAANTSTAAFYSAAIVSADAGT